MTANPPDSAPHDEADFGQARDHARHILTLRAWEPDRNLAQAYLALRERISKLESKLAQRAMGAGS